MLDIFFLRVHTTTVLSSMPNIPQSRHLSKMTQGTPKGDVHSQETVTLGTPWSIPSRKRENLSW